MMGGLTVIGEIIIGARFIGLGWHLFKYRHEE